MLAPLVFSVLLQSRVLPTPKKMTTKDISPCYTADCIGAAQPSQLKQRPHLLPYNPMPTKGATVVASDKMARFTVLTPRLIRMEYALTAGKFEDRASLAVVHRSTPLPVFQQSETQGVLTILTTSVKVTYVVGKGPFSVATLSVQPLGTSAVDGFPGWRFGDANPGNLLGTIRGQDQQSATPLNCTTNANEKDNGEYNHCEWGLISRDGWVVYDDTNNAHTDEQDWWSTTGTATTAPPGALTSFPPRQYGVQFSDVATDLYGFFHGLKFTDALREYQMIGGKAIMVPRFAMGVWWSRWYDLNNYDTKRVIDDYESRSIPLDVFVLDMDWHTKDDWSGFTFDKHLFPYAKDSMEAKRLPSHLR